jgi:hypothetical protein
MDAERASFRTARGELLDRELDAQVDEQEDQSERGEQLEVLGVGEEHRPRCERTDEDAREHEERDRGPTRRPAPPSRNASPSATSSRPIGAR